jgi:cytochrome c
MTYYGVKQNGRCGLPTQARSRVKEIDMTIRFAAMRVLAVSCLVLGTASAWASAQIAAKAGCVACHMADKKMVGPSWHDIAVKYKGQAQAPAKLAAAVRKGGGGVWGKVPMAPTDAARLSDADLAAVIGWVLKTP